VRLTQCGFAFADFLSDDNAPVASLPHLTQHRCLFIAFPLLLERERKSHPVIDDCDVERVRQISEGFL
jgi:hypothetical protein